MKAAVVLRYGSPDVLEVREVRTPAPGQGELLVRIHAAAVGRTDCGELRGHPIFLRLFTGLRRPRRSILGLDFAGEVAAVGSGVTSFRPGERVFGMCPSRSNGAQAEYLCVPEGDVAAIPDGLEYHEAVICEGAFYASAVLKKIGLEAGHTILIYGASGAIGTAMVQLAKSAGAEVTAVVATPHLDLAKSLGADDVVDYTAEDFTRVGRRFDRIVDAVGKTTYFRCRELLKPGGVFGATDMGPRGQTALLAIWSALTRSGRVVIPAPGRINRFPSVLRGLLETGRFRAVVDRTYSLDAIADAYRYVETGQKVGIVVIDVAPAVAAA